MAEGGSYADVARRFGVTREEVCQYVTLVRCLPAPVVVQIGSAQDPQVLRSLSFSRLLRICRLTDRRARRAELRRVQTLLGGSSTHGGPARFVARVNAATI